MNDKHYTKDTLDFHIQPAKAAFIGWPFSRVIQEFHCSYFHELKLKMRTNQSNSILYRNLVGSAEEAQ